MLAAGHPDLVTGAAFIYPALTCEDAGCGHATPSPGLS
jgi:hypothetical protein